MTNGTCACVALAVALAFGVAGCEKKPPESTTVVVLLDFSGSIPAPTVSFYANSIESKIWQELTAHDRLTILPVDSQAESKTDPFFAVDLSQTNFLDTHDGFAHKEEKEQMRVQAFIKDQSQKLKDAVVAAASARSGFRSGTDLIGALHAAANTFPDSGADRHLLVIFSDMIQESPELNLPSLAKAGDARVPLMIKELEDHKRIPKLTGVTVVVVGAGETSAAESGSSTRDEGAYFRSVRLFWMQFFERAGAKLEERNYGYRTQDVIPSMLHSR